jgi:hypothetical protein
MRGFIQLLHLRTDLYPLLNSPLNPPEGDLEMLRFVAMKQFVGKDNFKVGRLSIGNGKKE